MLLAIRRLNERRGFNQQPGSCTSSPCYDYTKSWLVALELFPVGSIITNRQMLAPRDTLRGR